MKLANDTRIAGEKTVENWAEMKCRLNGRSDPSAWTAAFSDFFKTRLESRYFESIRAIERLEKNVGEGFAIVTLHCSLIEFLASTLEGKKYKYRKNCDPPLGPFEYSKSREMFITFLENCEPFKCLFSAQGTAEDFYTNVRCGLLHEARTKGKWTIQVSESATQAVDVNRKVVYRNKMQAAFDEFIGWYGQQLPEDEKLQKAFVRKFDSLCDE